MEADSARRSRLLPDDVVRLGLSGVLARPVRTVLSALGIMIGIAAMVAVLGVAASSQERLNRQLAELGTNLVTAQGGKDMFGVQTALPTDAVGRISLMKDVESVATVAELKGDVYRNRFIDRLENGGITVVVADLGLLQVVSAQLKQGVWLNEATSEYPAVVLGSRTAERLGVHAVGSMIEIKGQLFTVVGVLKPLTLAPELDTAALIGRGVATTLFGWEGIPTTVYVRSDPTAVADVQSRLSLVVDPTDPKSIAVSRPSDALAAQEAAQTAFTGLLAGLGSVGLLVGGVGVANTMIISVIERRREIGLRRALGATRAHIRTQFLVESVALSLLGGAVGAITGAIITAVIAGLNGWPFAMPPAVLAVALVATVGVGAVAGLYPAIRAARTPPTAALASA